MQAGKYNRNTIKQTTHNINQNKANTKLPPTNQTKKQKQTNQFHNINQTQSKPNKTIKPTNLKETTHK